MPHYSLFVQHVQPDDAQNLKSWRHHAARYLVTLSDDVLRYRSGPRTECATGPYPWRLIRNKQNSLHNQRGRNRLRRHDRALRAWLGRTTSGFDAVADGAEDRRRALPDLARVNLWRSEPITPVNKDNSSFGNWSLFYQGLLSAISNPKALLLFTAFITPFIDPRGDLVAQAAILSVTYAVVEFGVELGVASAAYKVRPWLARAGRRFNQVCGGFFVIFGVLIPAH